MTEPTTLDRILGAWINAPIGAHPDMPVHQWQAIAAGKRRPTSLDLALIADAFRVTVDWLLTGDGSPTGSRLDTHPPLACGPLQISDGEGRSGPRCVCGDPIEWVDYEDEPGWIHSPGSNTRCLDARPADGTPSLTTWRMLSRLPLDEATVAELRTRLGEQGARHTRRSPDTTAREDLLQTLADWGCTTGKGSRVHADRILDRHRAELAPHAEPCLGHEECERCDVTDPCPCCGLRYVRGEWIYPATAAELAARQRQARHLAKRCPKCGATDDHGRLCGPCEAEVRRMPGTERRKWQPYRQLRRGTPIQGHGYTPAGLLGVGSEASPCDHTGPDAGPWFDRTVCPEPCGAMHERCSRCGAALGHCPVEEAGEHPLGARGRSPFASPEERRRVLDQLATEKPIRAEVVPCPYPAVVAAFGKSPKPHQPHTWAPQPGMRALWCPGVDTPAT